MTTIPILRARLPTRDRLMPYLERIDATRSYSNFGPLALELQQRLAARLDAPPACIVSAANATVALTAALLAQAPRPGSLCIMPAWTFVASPLAALDAGLAPYFVDVSPDDWLIQPAVVAEAVARLGGKVGAVMPVAPFGAPIDVAAWDRFRHDTGLAVVIDSAAGFDALRIGTTPNVVSLHATKALGSGEGGFIASRDEALLNRVRSYLAFGFSGGREALVAGVNGKLSEYHAAVGLASLDNWPDDRAAFALRAESYARALRVTNSVRLQSGFGTDWIANTCVVTLPDGAADQVAARLTAKAIETRHWWGAGAHRHRATAHLPRGPLAVTDRLATSTLGLPFYVDMPISDIERVAREVVAALAR